MRIRIAVPEAHVSAPVLNAALEATTRANEAMLTAGETHPISELIHHGKVKWKPESFKDGEHFDLGRTVQDRGWGDCDDLAPALAAELRVKGIDPGATAIVQRSGPNLWHAVTQMSDGEIRDPSKAAGMGKGGAKVSGFGEWLQGTSIMGLVDVEGAVLGLKPHGSKWAARVDLPIEDRAAAICGLALCGSPYDAVTQAVDAATTVGQASEYAHPSDLARALAIQGALAGEDYGDMLHALHGHVDGDELGEIFSHLAHSDLAGVIPAVKAFKPGKGLAAQAASMPKKGTFSFANMVATLARAIASAGKKPPAEAHALATEAVKKAMAHHGAVGEEQVGSFFGSILKTAASFVPIPGVSAIANAVVDAVDTGGGGGGGGGGAPAPAARGGRAAPAAAPVDWALQVRRGVQVTRSPNGAFMVKF